MAVNYHLRASAALPLKKGTAVSMGQSAGLHEAAYRQAGRQSFPPTESE
jgi:hypothetical protein